MSSRLLLLALTVVAAAIGGVNLSLTAPDAVRAVHNQLDGQLARAAKALPGALEAFSERGLALAAEVAASNEVQSGLSAVAKAENQPDQGLLDRVIGSADTAAEKRGERGIRSLVAVATGSGAAVFRQGAGNEFSVDTGVPLLKEALGGSRGSVVTAIGDSIYSLAATPVGSAAQPLGAIALGFPVDDAFANGLRDSLGVEVTLLYGGKVVATSLPAGDRGMLPAAAAAAGQGNSFGFGELPEESFSLFGLVKLPLFAADATSGRARSLRVPGLEGADVIVSSPTTAALVPIADAQKTTVLFTGVILVVGLLFTGLARAKNASYDAEDVVTLAEVTERAAAGDATARAAEFLPGDLGRLARAVNKLAQRVRPAASPAAAVQEAEATPAEALAAHFPFEGSEPETPAAGAHFDAAAPGTGGHSAGPDAEAAAVQAAADAFTFGDDAAPAAAPAQARAAPAEQAREPTAGPAAERAAHAFGGGFEPAAGTQRQTLVWDGPNRVQPGSDLLGNPAPAAASPGLATTGVGSSGGPSAADAFAQALQEVGQSQSAFNPEATIIAAVPEALLLATSRAAAPARPAAPPADPDELHFQEVYREFLATRERCGEPVGGLVWEKFLGKLQKNREQLVEKYGCRTVRFTVYVKEGKAALKATPIRS